MQLQSVLWFKIWKCTNRKEKKDEHVSPREYYDEEYFNEHMIGSSKELSIEILPVNSSSGNFLNADICLIFYFKLSI